MTKVTVVCGLFVEVVWVLSVWSTDGTVRGPRLMAVVVYDWKSTHHAAPTPKIAVRV